MIILDSSCWIDIFTKRGNYLKFVNLLAKPNEIIVPTISFLEVFKKLLIERGEREAMNIIGQMEQCIITDLTKWISLESAKFGKLYKLPLADSIIYATAQMHHATLYTMDTHFNGLPDVEYYEKV